MAPRDRVQRLRPALDETADRLVALGDPGAVVEQPAGLEEGREVDLFEREARRRRGRARRGVEGRLARERRRRSGGSPGPGRRCAPTAAARPSAPTATGFENGSSASKPGHHPIGREGVVDGRANTETQSSVRQAGTTPRVGTAPSVGFRPTMLLRAAGTRPEPAVSVPSAKATEPARHRDRRAGARAAGHHARRRTGCAARG